MMRPKGKEEIELKVGISFEKLIAAINSLEEEERDFLIENLLAATSPDYLKSIEEAREDYRRGRIFSHEEVFGKSDRE